MLGSPNEKHPERTGHHVRPVDACGARLLWQPVARSPHIDRLAAAGVVFDAAYTNSPLCTPARYCMMTGQLPSSTRGYDNAAYFASTIPTFAHYPAEPDTTRCCRARCISSAPTSCTASRSA